MKNKSLFAIMALGLALPVATVQAQSDDARPASEPREERGGDVEPGDADRDERPGRPQRFERRERLGNPDRGPAPDREERVERPRRNSQDERGQGFRRGGGMGPGAGMGPEDRPLRQRERIHQWNRDGGPGPGVHGNGRRTGPRDEAGAGRGGFGAGPGPGGRRNEVGPVPPLFALLDRNHDGRLNERELDNAGRALSRLDRNDDGEVTHQELRSGAMGLGRGPAGREQFGRGPRNEDRGSGFRGGSGDRRGPRPLRDGTGPCTWNDEGPSK